jgi:hypothetical protein
MDARKPRGIRRFFYVSGPHCTVAHIMFGKTHSTGLTACGRIVRKGWGWSQKKSMHERVCKQCENAA